jgi:DNA repair protein RAD50
LNEEKDDLENQRTKLAVEFGELRKSMEQLKSQKDARDKHIVAFAKIYKMEEFTETPFDDEKALLFITKATKMLDRVKEKIKEIRAAHQGEVQGINEELDKQRNIQSDLQSDLDSKKRKIAENNNEMQRLEKELKTNKSMYDKLDEREELLTREKNNLVAAKSQFDEEAFKDILKGLEAKRTECTKKMQQLSDLIQVLNSQSSLSAKVDHLRQEKAKQEAEQTKMLKSIENQFMDLLGEVVTPDQMKSTLEAKARTARQELAQAKSNQSKLSSKSSQLAGQITFVEDQAKELAKQIKEKQAKLKDLPEGTNLPDSIRQLDERINVLKKDLASTKALEVTFMSFIDQTKKTHHCPLCSTDFGQDVSGLVSKLEEFTTNVPAKIAELESNILNAIKEKEKLDGLVEHWNRFQALESELATLHEKRDKMKLEVQEHDTNLHQLNSVVEEKTKKLEELNKMIPLAEQLANHTKNLSQVVNELDQLEQKLASFDSAGRSLNDVSNELKQEQNNQEALSKELEQKRQELQNGKDKIHKMERQVSELEKEVLQLRGMNDKIVVSKQKYDSLAKESEEIEPLLISSTADLEEAKQKLVQLTTKRDEMVKVASQKEEKHQKDKEAFTAKLIELQGMQKEISKINPAEIEERGRQVTEDKELIESKLSDIAQKIKEKQDETQHIASQLSNQDQYKRNLEDNIRYRNDDKILQALKAKILKLKETKQSSNSESVIEDIEALTAQIDESKSKLNQLLGSRNAYVEQVKSKNVDLKKPENSTAEDEYRRMLIKFKTTDMASADLDKYYKALDKALMKFHSMKMAEINKIIKELWQNTYKGNDIQTIEIRADQEETSGKRNYNYRLVMIKGDTELDMRGRCSAGQKVLSSLVIRLALAETFCLNCGILALDEPTTNLDRYNVESFAGALVNIIENRKQQRNFQLIIITHDEEFVQLLGRSEHADHYWRVSKDQNQHSTIEKQEIVDL